MELRQCKILMSGKFEISGSSDGIPTNSFTLLQTDPILDLSQGHILIGSEFEISCGSIDVSIITLASL
jgi:hypothetical protein